MSSKQLFYEPPIPRKTRILQLMKPTGENPQGFRNAPRIQESFTSRLERRSLLWMAARMPQWVNSDHLTVLGFIAMLLASGSYALSRWEPAGLLLATLFISVNWFGDSLDGTLARVRNRQRPRYGFYVDHMIDSFGSLFLITGLGVSGYIDWRIAISMLVVFLLLSIETYLSTYAVGVFRLSFGKLGPTEIRIVLAVGNIALWLNPNARIPGLTWRLFNFGGLVATTGMAIMVILAAVCHTVRLYQEETKP